MISREESSPKINNLEAYILDQAVEDIVIRPDHFFYFKNSTWSESHSLNRDEGLSMKILRLSEEAAQINLGMTQPCADSVIRLGTDLEFRSHVVVAPMSQQVFEITLRRIRKKCSFRIEDFFFNSRDAELLKEKFLKSESILVAGATGCGKSSLISALLQLLPENERVLILEDTPELPLPNGISTKLVARTNHYKLRLGAEWNLEQIVVEALRMRPSRIVLGECRSGEAKAVYQAQQTGHRGVLTSIHAGSATEALQRFYELAGFDDNTNKHQVWDCVVFMENHAPNGRKVKQLLTELKCLPS